MKVTGYKKSGIFPRFVILFLIIFLFIAFISFFGWRIYAEATYFDERSEFGSALPFDVYDDGVFRVTSEVDGWVNGKTGNVTCKDKITIENLTESKYITFNCVRAVLNDGFETAVIETWLVKNANGEILFSGGVGDNYVPSLKLDAGEIKEFSVTTTLYGLEAGKLVNQNPFRFVYDYTAEWTGFTATVDTNDGFVKSDAPSDWTKNSETTYTKKFPDSTAYSVILAEWDGATFEHSTDPESYSFGGFSPLSGTLTADTIFSVQWSAYLYKVCIWGIGEDQYDSNPNHKVGLTFGPAIGSSRDCLEYDGGHTHCIHNDSWETIIANCNAGHADWYSDCLNDGCTKAVPINMNTTIGSKPTSKIECTIMYDYLNDSYNRWNKEAVSAADHYNCESANYATSRIRATLNGKNGNESKYAGTDCLDSTNCLLSCFPKVLQDNIMPKYMEVATSWEPFLVDKTGTYPIKTSTSIADKLWLLNDNEIYGNPKIDYNDYRSQYSKAYIMGINWSTYSMNLAFKENGGQYWRWQRSPKRYWTNYAARVGYNGEGAHNVVAVYGAGLSPCFCLGASRNIQEENQESLGLITSEKFDDVSGTLRGQKCAEVSGNGNDIIVENGSFDAVVGNSVVDEKKSEIKEFELEEGIVGSGVLLAGALTTAGVFASRKRLRWRYVKAWVDLGKLCGENGLLNNRSEKTRTRKIR